MSFIASKAIRVKNNIPILTIKKYNYRISKSVTFISTNFIKLIYHILSSIVNQVMILYFLVFIRKKQAYFNLCAINFKVYSSLI